MPPKPSKKCSSGSKKAQLPTVVEQPVLEEIVREPDKDSKKSQPPPADEIAKHDVRIYFAPPHRYKTREDELNHMVRCIEVTLGTASANNWQAHSGVFTEEDDYIDMLVKAKDLTGYSLALSGSWPVFVFPTQADISPGTYVTHRESSEPAKTIMTVSQTEAIHTETKEQRATQTEAPPPSEPSTSTSSASTQTTPRRSTAKKRRKKKKSATPPGPEAQQCYRCLNLGHLSTTCTAERRCDRCGGAHSHQTCAVDRATPTCANCGGQHAASHRRCPNRPTPVQSAPRHTPAGEGEPTQPDLAPTGRVNMAARPTTGRIQPRPDRTGTSRQHQPRGNSAASELRLDRNSLDAVPGASLNGPRALRTLSLAHNRIAVIRSGALLAQRSLESVDVSNNLLSTVEGGALSGLGRLRELRLARNKLTRFNSDVFQGAESLEHLDLSDNFLSEVPSVALKVFSSLKRLNLSSNSIKSLEGANLGAQPDLQQLDLSRNGLASVTAGTFLGLRQLRVLDLSVNSLRTVEDEVFAGLESLEVLSLLDNNVLLVPGSALARLPRLAVLHLDYNRIAALSGDILRSLADRVHTLSLARNVVRELPANSFHEFKQLASLDLTSNLLASVAAATFTGLEDSLVELRLGHNRLAALTGPPLSLPELRLLDLSRNQLNEVSRDAFSLLPSLLHLNLSLNPQLALLPSTALHGLPQLASLDLSGTGLKQLPTLSTALIQVFLRGNTIQEISDGAFQDLQNLTTIDLSDNHILNIRPGAFAGLTSIKKVSLKGNRLSAFKGEYFKPVHGSDTNAVTTLEELDLSENELSYLFPSSFRIHPRLCRLVVSRNRFSFFPAELIASLQFLEYVDLSGNDLKSVEELDFARLPRLRILILARNQIEAVSESAFHNSTQLQVLDLSSNKLQRLGERTFEGLARIEKLDLQNNLLSELPDSIFERSRLQMLENINLSQNKFEVPPLKTLQRQYFFLSSVDLSRNLLQEIPPEDSIMVNIKKLDLSFNPLSEEAIANVLGEPKTVRELNLAGTGIVKVTQLETPFLRVLNLSYNEIVDLPDKVFERPTLLEALDLSYNKISDLSATLLRVWSRLNNLQAVDLSGNPITGIMAGDFDGLESLQSMKIANLEHCMRVEKNAFKPLGNLVELIAYGYSRLGYLDVPGILQNLPVLETLDIELKDAAVSSEQLAPALHARMSELTVRGPRVRSISSGALAGLKSPSVCVGLRNTSLTSLPPALFFPVPRSTLVKLDVSGSHLSTLSPQLLATLDERRGDLSLHGLASNPILCDCSARALRRWLPGAGMAGIKCSAPENLAGKLLVETADDELTCDPNRQTTATAATTAMISPSTRASKATTEPDIIWSLPPAGKDKTITNKPTGVANNKATPTTSANSPNNDDTLIIGIVGGVVAFIIILIIVICIIRLRITNNQYRGGPLAAGQAPSMLTGSNCTCVKPPPGPPLYMAPYGPNYAATLPPKMSSASAQGLRPAYATMGRQPYYQSPPYFITYPAEEKDHR